jgi:hypothetical protein
MIPNDVQIVVADEMARPKRIESQCEKSNNTSQLIEQANVFVLRSLPQRPTKRPTLLFLIGIFNVY